MGSAGQRRPRFRKVKVSPSEYLAFNDAGTRLFLLVRYEEDGSAWRGEGESAKQIKGLHWRVRMLNGDWTDAYEEIESPRRIVQRRQSDRVIVDVRYDLLDQGLYRDISDLHPRLRDAWEVAAWGADEWLDDREGLGG